MLLMSRRSPSKHYTLCHARVNLNCSLSRHPQASCLALDWPMRCTSHDKANQGRALKPGAAYWSLPNSYEPTPSERKLLLWKRKLLSKNTVAVHGGLFQLDSHLLEICHGVAGTGSEVNLGQQGNIRGNQVLALRGYLARGEVMHIKCKAQCDSKAVMVVLVLLGCCQITPLRTGAAHKTLSKQSQHSSFLHAATRCPLSLPIYPLFTCYARGSLRLARLLRQTAGTSSSVACRCPRWRLARHPLLDHLHAQRWPGECLAARCGAAAAEQVAGHTVQHAHHLWAHATGSVQGLVRYWMPQHT